MAVFEGENTVILLTLPQATYAFSGHKDICKMKTG